METDREFISLVWAEAVHKFIFPVSLCMPLSFSAGKSLEPEPDITVKVLATCHHVYDMSHGLLVLLKLTRNSGCGWDLLFSQKSFLV